jgi:prepilin-type N-terminal cleavage/methylation domain-containing protein
VAERGGLTLVEMLIVVAIIVLLAAIMLPVFEQATKHAEGAVCISNIRNLCTAAAVYADDWDGRCVPARVSGPAGTFGTCWEVLLMPYTRSSLLLLCPTDPMPSATRSSVSLKHSYGINFDIAMVGGYNGNSLCYNMIDRPAETILFFDLRGGAGSMGGSHRLDGLSRVEARHNDGANFAFVAGNARWFRLEQTERIVSGDCTMWEPW